MMLVVPRRHGIIPLEEGWNEILQNVHHHGQFLTSYNICFGMCTQRYPNNFSRELYQRHGLTITQYVQEEVLPAIRDKTGLGGTILLNELQRGWIRHQVMNRRLKMHFSYLDRYYVKHHSLPTLLQAGLTCFRTNVYDEMKGQTTAAILQLINDEREGQLIDKSLVKRIVKLYEEMSIGSRDAYKEDLEVPLLESTREFYAKKREEWIDDSILDYLIKAEAALTDERTRVADYLNTSTESKLLKVVDEEILEKVQTVLLEKESSGCWVLLQNDKAEDLQRLFRLYQRLENSFAPIASIMQDFITSMGMDVINHRQARLDGGEKVINDDPRFIKSLIDLHEKSLGVVKNGFSCHPHFQRVLKDSFVEIINKTVGTFTTAELMASFCDRILKSGGKRLSETEVEKSLDRIVPLVSYLTDKEVFAEIYRSQLARRLLSQNCTNDDAEKLMIAKLKVQFGSQFTCKMEAMLNDLADATQQREAFEKCTRNIDTRLEFSVQALTTALWPSYKSLKVKLPPEMNNCINVFQEWHEKNNPKRNLAWVLTLGIATVQGTFGNKSYDLIVSTLQAIALRALDGGDTLSLEDLGHRLNLGDSILKPLLHSLSCGKYRVINKTPAGNEINAGDKFAANPNFTCNRRQIRIPMSSLDSSFNTEKMKEDRSVAIDAAIVRIMKARKRLSHQQLLAEVVAQLSFFNADTRVIKRRIEGLIEREYLERSAERVDVYNYLD